MQDYVNPIADALELPQPFTKPSIYDNPIYLSTEAMIWRDPDIAQYDGI